MPEVHQSRLISKKPFILLFFAMSLLIVLGGRIYYRNEVRTILAEKHDALHTIADLKTDQIVNWLRERKSDAFSVSASPFFSQAVNTWVTNGGNDPDLQKKILAQLQIVQEQYRYADILLATPQGKLLMALEPQRRRLDPIAAKQIVIACNTGNVHFTDFYYCPLHKQIHLDFIAPVANPGNKPQAVLILRNAPEKFLYPLIQKWPTHSKTAETLIVRQDGDSVLFLNNLRYNSNAALRLHISMADTNTAAVRAVLGQTGIFDGKDYRGIRVLSHIGAVPETNWFLIAKIDRQEIYSDLNTELRFVSILVVILLVMVGIGMALIYNHRQRGVYHALYIEEKSRFAVQEEFRTTLYSIGDAVITTDHLGRIKYLNPVAEKLTGWQEKEAEGRDLPEVFNIVNEETRQIVPNPVRRVLDVGLIVGLANHTILISKKNQEIPIADSGAPIKGEDGEIIGVILVFRDQTAERASQSTIRNSEKELRTIWESSRDGMRLCNAEGIMIRVNPAFCHMVGKPESELIGKPLSVIYHNYAAEHILAKDLERFQADTIEPHFERLVTLHDGRSVWFELSNSTVEINDEKLQLNIFRNITERKLAEKDLRESEERFHSTLDGMMEGAQIIGFDWRYLYINSTAEKQFHRSKMDLLGKKFTSVWPGIDQTTLFIVIKRCMEERIPVHIENEFDFPGGSIGLFEFSIQPIPQGIFILSVDIAKRRQVEEQIRYQADLLKNVSDAIIATDTDKQITMWNPAAEVMYGWKAEDVLGKKFRDIVNPEYIYDSRETVFEKIKKEGAWSGELVHLSKSGRPLSVLSTISEIKNNSSDNIGMVSINHDISEQKKMDAQFRSVWEKSQDGMRLTDENGKVIQVNDAFCRMMGIERSEIEDQSLAVIYVEEQMEHVENMHRERFSAHAVKPYSEQKVTLRDGRKIWVEVRNTFFETGSHKPLLLGIFRDITNRKETEDALKMSEEKLRQSQKMEALGQLASGIAHDFNNILAIIMGHSELLKMGQQSPEKIQHSIKTIEKTSKRGADLVKQLLTLARRNEPVLVSLNLNEMITEIVKMLNETFPKLITFQTDVQPSLPFILADASQINQVLMNLCVNARDAMPNGGILRIAAKHVSGQILQQQYLEAVAAQYVVINVSDTGVGMDQAILNRIFEPFFTTKEKGKGTGLGLSTVLGIVSNHNGFIKVDSKPGAGTVVSVFLPAPMDSEVSGPLEIEDFQKIKGGGETVLVIEDEELLIEMLNSMLTKYSYNVLLAKDGLEGITLFTKEKDKISLVVTDMGLPKLTGDAVLHRIMKINPKAKVIVASGYLSPDDKSELFKAGLARFIQKPFMPIDILKAIREELDKK